MLTFSQTKEEPSRVLKRLQNDESCDIELVGKRTGITELALIKGHKMILSAASPFLKQALASVGFRDSTLKKKLSITSIDHSNLKVIVDYIYSNELKCSSQVACVFLKDILKGAHFLIMPELVRLCEDSLVTRLKQTSRGWGNVDIWLDGKKYSCAKLALCAVDRLRCTLKQTMVDSKFLNLSPDNVFLLLKEMGDRMMSSAEPTDDLCKAAVAWLTHKGVSSSEFGLKLMCSMPLSEMSVEGLKQLSEKQLLSPEAVGLVSNILRLRKTEAALRKELAECKDKLEELKDASAGTKATSSARKRARK